MPPPQPQPKISVPTPLPYPLPPPHLTSLTTALLTANAIPPILHTLTTECQKAKWQDAVKARIMQMLKDEGYIDKAEILRVLVREARGLDTKEEGKDDEGDDEGDSGVQKGMKAGKGEEGKIDVRVPEKAVSEGVKIVKGYLEKVVEVEPEVVDFWSS